MKSRKETRDRVDDGVGLIRCQLSVLRGSAIFSFAAHWLSRQECRDSSLETEIPEHRLFKRFPGKIRIWNAADCALHDAGVGRAEALEGGIPADLVPELHAPADARTKQIGGPGDPGALERMDDNASLIAEDGVVEGNRVISDQ